MKTFKYKIVETASKDILLILHNEEKEMIIGKCNSLLVGTEILQDIEQEKRDFLGNLVLLEKEITLDIEE